MGVVYYANYFVWFEVARADLLRSLGWRYREMEHAGVSLPVIEAHCEYHRSGAVRRRDGGQDGRAHAVAGADGVHLQGRAPRRPVGRGVRAARFMPRSIAAGKPCRLPDRIRQVFA